MHAWSKLAGDEPYGMPSVEGGKPPVFLMPASWDEVTWNVDGWYDAFGVPRVLSSPRSP